MLIVTTLGVFLCTSIACSVTLLETAGYWSPPRLIVTIQHIPLAVLDCRPLAWMGEALTWVC